MGNTPSAGQGQPPRGQGQEGNEGQGEDPWDETADEKDGTFRHNLFFDENQNKYYDPTSGESVATPGKFEPEPVKRPVRVKVRKRQNYTLRKRRRKPKPIPVPQSPDPPTPPKPLRPPTQYDADGYAIYYDEFGTRIEYDENGYLIPPEPYQDDYGEVYEPTFDEYGNLIVYDSHGIPVDNDENGDPVEYDRYGYPLEYDEQGNPKERTYYPKYDEYGNEIPQKKKKDPKFEYPDDGYDYDDSIYTYTTLDSPILPTPSPVSSDDVQEGDDSGDDLSMEDVTEFRWKPYQPVMPKDEARALIKTGGEDCSCFPKRSDPLIPSMVYDQLTCHHTNNVMGKAHGAVIRFDDNWNDRYTKVHRPKRHERQRSKVTSVWGYPNRQFPDYKLGDELFEGGLRGEFQKPTSRQPEVKNSGTADKKKESATGSQKPASKEKTPVAEETKPDTKKSKKELKKEQKAREKEEAERKKKEAKEKSDNNKTSEQSKRGDKPTSKNGDVENADDGKSKTESKKGSRKGTADEGKEKDAEQEDEGKPKSNQGKEGTASNSKDTKEQAKPNSKQAAQPTKGDKPEHLSRQKMDQTKLNKTKDEEAAKGRVENKSRTSVVAKSFLPKIGYTPDHPFSNAKQRSPSPDDAGRQFEPLSLPPIPASPAYSLVSSMTTSSQDFDHQPDIPTSARRFEGKYYDPVTKKTYTYEIKPRFGKHVQDWDALRQV